MSELPVQGKTESRNLESKTLLKGKGLRYVKCLYLLSGPVFDKKMDTTLWCVHQIQGLTWHKLRPYTSVFIHIIYILYIYVLLCIKKPSYMCSVAFLYPLSFHLFVSPTWLGGFYIPRGSGSAGCLSRDQIFRTSAQPLVAFSALTRPSLSLSPDCADNTENTRKCDSHWKPFCLVHMALRHPQSNQVTTAGFRLRVSSGTLEEMVKYDRKVDKSSYFLFSSCGGGFGRGFLHAKRGPPEFLF